MLNELVEPGEKSLPDEEIKLGILELSSLV